MKTLKFIIVLFIGFIIGSLSMKFDIENTQQKVDLPEEYLYITSSDNLKGYYDINNVLHIEFDNSLKFEWEGLEKDIPNSKEYIQITGKKNNTIYLNPIDE
jgi:hypothetical protein